MDTIPQNIKDKIELVSLQTFGKHVKTWFIDKYDPVCRNKKCYVCQNPGPLQAP